MKKLYWLALLLAVVVLVFSAAKLFAYFDEARDAEILNDTMYQSAVSEPGESIGAAAGESHEIIAAPIDVNFDALITQYPDLVAWIYCPGTPINYPVMYSGDNDFYLRRLPDGTSNPNGSLFLDYRNATDFSDLHSIVYGHNMKNDYMFGTLELYQEQEYYDAHPVMYLLTPEQDYEIRLIGAYITSADSDAYEIPQTSEERETLLNLALANSYFVPESRPTGQEPLITLSTCTYTSDNARFLVVGYLNEIG